MTHPNPSTEHDIRAAWRRAIAQLPATRRFPELRSFGGYCTRQGIEPAAITEATIAAFAEHLQAKGCKHVTKRTRTVRHQLNAACASGGWPGPRVAEPPQADQTRVHRPLSAFMPSFQRALARLQTELHASGLTPPDRAHSLVTPATAAKITQRVRESASLMVDLGLIELAPLTAPDQILDPHKLTALFNHLETRVAPTHVRNYAKALIPVCRVYRHRGSDVEQLVAARMRATPVERETIPGTPTETLLALVDSDASARLTAFPDHAFEQAESANGALAARAWSKAGAAVVIALSAPLAPGEIAGLRIGDVAPDGRPERIKAPGDSPARGYSIPSQVADYLARHLDHLPRLDPEAPLMPGNACGPTSSQSLATLVERYVQPAVGLPVTLRVLYLRHLALLLRDDPSDIDRVLAWTRLTGAAHGRQRLRLLAQLWQPTV